MNSIRRSIIAVIMFAVPLLSGAQTLKEANDAYNEASKLIMTDKAATIKLFEKALAICNSLGSAGDTTRQKIEGFMAGLYFEDANSTYKEKKYEEAIPKFRKASEVADKYNNDSYKERCTRYIANCYLNMGNNALRNNLLDTAISYYQTSFNLEPKGSKWFSIGQIYLKQGNEEKMATSMNKAIEIAKTENDTSTVNKANRLCRQYYYAQATALQTKNGSRAIEYLDKAVRYEPKFADAYWMKTLITYKMKKWQESADAANAALANETDPNERPKIYFKLGWIYVYLKMAPEACAAFKQASRSKDFAEESKINMKNLQCN